MQVSIHITADAIRQGSRGSLSTCPLAISIGEVLYPGMSVGISKYCFLIRNANREILFTGVTPPKMSQFIQTFDSFQDVEPVTLKMYIPTGYVA